MILLLLCYDILFLAGLVLYLPRALRRKKINSASLKQKLGSIGIRLQKPSIWIQVVSVGEVNVIGKLLQHVRERFPHTIVISTTTLTGNKLAKEKYGAFAKVIFFPFDISCVIRRVIALVKPALFIAVETEIWPNLYFQLSRRKVPILILNGRISKKAFARYTRIRGIMERVLRLCAYVAVQNQDYKEKFLALGMPEDKIVVSGNMKFESIYIDPEKSERVKEKYAQVLKPGGSMLVVAGSTHPGEEEYLLEVYKTLLAEGLRFILAIAPRHIERAESIEKLVVQSGLRPVRLSAPGKQDSASWPVYILDTIGELFYLYGIADICFVGGTLAAHGGHNILEPIFFSKPTLFGPFMDNFEDIKEAILNARAGVQVKDARELKSALRALITDKAHRESISKRCAEVFSSENKGLGENIGLIAHCLEGSAEA